MCHTVEQKFKLKGQHPKLHEMQKWLESIWIHLGCRCEIWQTIWDLETVASFTDDVDGSRT